MVVLLEHILLGHGFIKFMQICDAEIFFLRAQVSQINQECTSLKVPGMGIVCSIHIVCVRPSSHLRIYHSVYALLAHAAITIRSRRNGRSHVDECFSLLGYAMHL